MLTLRQRVERDQAAAGRAHIEHRQRRGIALELWRDLHHHLILIVRRVDLRHLPGAVGVVECGLHLVHREAERRDPVAVHVHANLRVLHLQIAADVLEPGNLPDLVLEHRRPVVEFRGVGVLQRELIRAARALLPAQVDLLRHVDEHAQARHLGHQRTQRRDDLLRRLRPLVARLEIDVDVAAVAEDEVRQTVDARVAADDLGDLLRLAAPCRRSRCPGSLRS